MTQSQSKMPLNQIRRSPTESPRSALNFHSRIQGIPDNLDTLKSPSAALDGRRDCGIFCQGEPKRVWEPGNSGATSHRKTDHRPEGRSDPLDDVTHLKYGCREERQRRGFLVFPFAFLCPPHPIIQNRGKEDEEPP